MSLLACAGMGSMVRLGSTMARSIAHDGATTAPTEGAHATALAVSSQAAGVVSIPTVATALERASASAELLADARAFERVIAHRPPGAVHRGGPFGATAGDLAKVRAQYEDVADSLASRTYGPDVRRQAAQATLSQVRWRLTTENTPPTRTDVTRTVRALQPLLGDGLVTEVSDHLVSRFALFPGLTDTASFAHNHVQKVLQAVTDGDAVALESLLAQHSERGFAYAAEALDEALGRGTALWNGLEARFGGEAAQVPTTEVRALAEPALTFMRDALEANGTRFVQLFGEWSGSEAARAQLAKAAGDQQRLLTRLASIRTQDTLTWNAWWDLTDAFASAVDGAPPRLKEASRITSEVAARPYLPVPSSTAGYWEYDKVWAWRHGMFPAEVPATRKNIGNSPAGQYSFYQHDLGHIDRTRRKLQQLQASGELPWLEAKQALLESHVPSLAPVMRSVLGEYLWEGGVPKAAAGTPKERAAKLLTQWRSEHAAPRVAR